MNSGNTSTHFMVSTCDAYLMLKPIHLCINRRHYHMIFILYRKRKRGTIIQSPASFPYQLFFSDCYCLSSGRSRSIALFHKILPENADSTTVAHTTLTHFNNPSVCDFVLKITIKAFLWIECKQNSN